MWFWPSLEKCWSILDQKLNIVSKSSEPPMAHTWKCADHVNRGFPLFAVQNNSQIIPVTVEDITDHKIPNLKYNPSESTRGLSSMIPVILKCVRSNCFDRQGLPRPYYPMDLCTNPVKISDHLQGKSIMWINSAEPSLIMCENRRLDRLDMKFVISAEQIQRLGLFS